MQLHQTRSASLSSKKRMRVGRGPSSGIGKFSGRGMEGATSRSGWAMKATYEGGQMPLFRRLPKRGFVNGAFRVDYATVNIAQLAKFPAGSTVSAKELREAGVLKEPNALPLKVLGDGEIKIALTVSAEKFSKSAEEKIVKAGGKAQWLTEKAKKPAPNFVAAAKQKKYKLAADQAIAELEKAKGAKKEKPAAKAAKPATPPKPPGERPEKKDNKEGK